MSSGQTIDDAMNPGLEGALLEIDDQSELQSR